MGATVRTPDEIREKIVTDYVDNKLGCTTIARKYGLSGNTVNRILHQNKVTIRDNREKTLKNSCDSHYFDVIDTEEKAYWLGFLLADGYITIRSTTQVMGCTLGIQDIEHLAKLKEALSATHNINVYTVTSGYNPGSKYCRLVISDPILVQSLISHGVVEHKTNIACPPYSIIGSPFECDCLRGYFDGNGCITMRKPSDSQTLVYTAKICATDTILNWFKEFAISNGVQVNSKPYKRKAYQKVSQMDIGGSRKAQAFLDLLYRNASVYLDRKYERYLELCKRNITVELTGNSEC